MWRCLFVVLAVAGVARAEPKVSLERLKEIVNDARTKHKVPAMAAAVVTSKGVHAMTWLGVRKNGVAVGVTAKDRWHLGSDTKAFTATLMAVLAEQGKVDYDATLPRLLPSLASAMSAEYKAATLDQALRHRSGLPSNLKDWRAVPATGTIQAQRLQALRRGLAMTPVAKPGEKYSYSNLGYVLAGAAAERAADAPWEQLLEKHVLRPLEIKEFGFGPVGTVGKLEQPMAHDAKGRPVEPTPGADNPPVMGPSTRLHLSLEDWARFAQDQLLGAQGKGRLLKPEGYKKLQTVEKDETYTAGGWIAETSAGFLILTHDGSNAGNYASAALIPSFDVAVLVVCNQGPKAGEAACKQAMLAAIKAALVGGAVMRGRLECGD